MCQNSSDALNATTNVSVPPFVHLHGHTFKSRGDATSRPKELVKKAFLDGQKSIAVTDHGIASAWVEMAKACKEVTAEAQQEERQRLIDAGLPVDEAAIAQIGIKFIPGVEMYETNDRLIQNKAQMEQLGYSTHHFLMLPKTNEGLKNLNRIISDASLNGQFYGRNRTDLKTIEANGWGEGIIATSACLASRTSHLILNGDLAGAKAFALECERIFDAFYLELQDNNIKDQYIVNQGLIQIAQDTGLPLVYTQDYHYVDLNDQDLHDTWICIGRGQEKLDPTRQGYDGGPYHFATQQEMYDAVVQGTIPQEAYDNTVIIADQCNVEFDFKKNRFPKYKFIDVGYTADTMLRKLSFDALYDYAIERNTAGSPIDLRSYMDRLDYELKVISDKKYSDYFLILSDIFGFCYRENIWVGPGRGSGAGSMVAYLNKITGIDPIEHHLLFERFLNPERSSAPDIDFDIEHSRREEVFQYIIDRFGKDHTAQIVTYGKEKLRSGIDDLCRTLKQVDEKGNVIAYGKDLADVIKKTIPLKFPDQTDPTYAKMKQLSEDPEQFREKFRDQTDKLHLMAVDFMNYMTQYPEIHTGIRFIEGLLRNYGIHAAAVVITDEPITDHIPVYKSSGLMPVTAFSMKEVDEDLNMLKLDALSLSTMTTVGASNENINLMSVAQSNVDFDIRKIPLDDENTFKTIRDGHTNGVFQISGAPITAFTKRVRPWTFNEIVDVLALFRPGPLDAFIDQEAYGTTTMAEKYIENADDQELSRYMQSIPQELHWIYNATRGILIYQEQILQLAQHMAGYSLGGADILRRAIGKKDDALLASVRAEYVYGTEDGIPILEDQIAQLESVPADQQDKEALDTFKKQLKGMRQAIKDGKAVEGSVKRGYDEQYSINTFESIRRFSGYSFNRSHSAAYAMIAYWTAYMKTHYPVEFMAAQLTVQAGDIDDTTANVQECRRLGIDILPPDINKSKLGFTIELVPDLDENGNATGQYAKAIRYGLESIKGVGTKVVEEILRRPARSDDPDSEGAPYTNLDDFFNRVDKRTINKSYFEKLIKAGCFDFDVQNRYAMLNHFSFNLRKDKEFLGHYKDFLAQKKDKKIKADTNFRMNPKDYDEDVLCEFELDLLGFYLSHHPYSDLPYENWADVPERATVDMGGKITAVKKIKTRKGDHMCFLTVETAGGKFDVTVFPQTFTQFQPELFKDNIAIFRGRKETGQNDKASMILDKILKAKKKKFTIEKPPELEQMAIERKQEKKKGEQMMMDEYDHEPVVRPDPLAGMFDGDFGQLEHEYADGGNWIREEQMHNTHEKVSASSKGKEEKQEFDLASLFD